MPIAKISVLLEFLESGDKYQTAISFDLSKLESIYADEFFSHHWNEIGADVLGQMKKAANPESADQPVPVLCNHGWHNWPGQITSCPGCNQQPPS